MLNFEIASSSGFQALPKRSFCDGEVGDGSGGMNDICCSRSEAADDVISSEAV